MELISHGNKAMAEEIISICKTETAMAPVCNQNLLWPTKGKAVLQVQLQSH